MADFEGAKKLNFEGDNASPEEWDRLRRENRDLQLTRDKLVKKLDKRKNELENEKTNTTVFRQLYQEQKKKVEILERETLQVINPSRFDPGPALTGEIVEREKNEIETLKSEISSMKTKLVLANQNLEIARGEIDRFEKQIPELKLELSEMENESNRLGTSTNDRDTLQQLLNDKTTETETLKTKIQDLSTTNKHYFSQLQRKNFTIETTTNKFDKEKQQIQEQAKQMETNLNEQLIAAKKALDEKCFALEDDKNVLEIQVNVLHVQIGELSEEREKWQRQVAELEATVTRLQVQLQKLGEAQQNETETIKKYEQQITELTNQITILTALKENAAISQKLIGKLNQDIKMLETNNKQTQGQFQMELTESKRLRDDLERKLEEMTDRNRKIRELTQPTAIQQGMGQVSKSPSTPILGSNPKQEEAKSQSKVKYPDPSTGATNMELTSQLVPQPNKTGKSPSKITFRGTTIHVVKLKAFPNMIECFSKQVICTINKHCELGQLMCIAELATKVGLRNAVVKYAGIKLYSPVGNCDGTYKDMMYFDCPPNYGIFVPLEDVYVPVP